jgi:hypothetical protein
MVSSASLGRHGSRMHEEGKQTNNAVVDVEFISYEM